MKARLEKRLVGRGAAIVCVAALVVVCLALVYAQRRSARRQERPRAVSSSVPATALVKAGDNFQAALDRARPGDTIMLEAGATFRGAFRLPNKPGATDFITIRSSASDSQLPAPGQRLDPARYAAVLPKIISGEAAPAPHRPPPRPAAPPPRPRRARLGAPACGGHNPIAPLTARRRGAPATP